MNYFSGMPEWIQKVFGFFLALGALVFVGGLFWLGFQVLKHSTWK